MQLKNDIESKNLLDKTILDFFGRQKGRIVRNFMRQEEDEGAVYCSYFLIDRRHVIRYSIGRDRGYWLGALELAIGPHYFGVADFWSYEASEQFSLEATTTAVEKNLALLDEFLDRK